MKFCLSNRQPYSVLDSADEIKVSARDKDILYDFIEKFPNKSIVLETDNSENLEKNYNFYQMCLGKFDKFCITINDLTLSPKLQEKEIPWYWAYPITSYVELRSIVELKPAYLLIAAPLTFSLDRVADIADGIPLRMVVDNFGPNYLPNVDTLKSQWVRPEDIEIYGTRIEVFEFKETTAPNGLKFEETLFRIYKSGQWSGNLNLLLPALGINVDNRGIWKEFGEKRMNCGQRCYETSVCHICENVIKFSKSLEKEKEKDGKRK